MTTPTNSALHMMEGRPSVPLAVSVAISAYGDARADDDGTSAARLGECINEIRNAMAAAVAKTALQHFADEVEASGEAEKHAYPPLPATDKALCGYDNDGWEEWLGDGYTATEMRAYVDADRAAMRHELDKFKALYTAAFEGLVRERGINKELAAAMEEVLEAYTRMLHFKAFTNKEIEAMPRVAHARAALAKVQQ